MKMPKEYRGKCTLVGMNCGICAKVHQVRLGEFKRTWEARKAARGMGWIYRNDLGWICPCRHRCENLRLEKLTVSKSKRKRSRRARV